MKSDYLFWSMPLKLFMNVESKGLKRRNIEQLTRKVGMSRTYGFKLMYQFEEAGLVWMDCGVGKKNYGFGYTEKGRRIKEYLNKIKEEINNVNS